ncbi:MAG TPA: dual specificity protein phosphatase [Ktedonobacteraceae bacterium]|jgi:protein-tyrosine phosphatase|nr:dual specificity protein phosphatase [Ktedonobacteraceae bacterium]
MSTDPEVTSPSADTPETIPVERPHVNFSVVRWFSTGMVRLSYRGWTRIAAYLFPEDSKAEQFAQNLHIPLPDKLNMSWITTHLAVGGRVHPDDIKALAAVGITHVVDTRSEYCDDAEALAKEHIELLHLPTPDTKPLTIEQMLKGSQWVQERMKQGGRVLIHCEHGVGRSALLTCAVLVYNGMHAYDALHLVQEKRWQAAPNHRQVRRLREFESAVVASRNA